MSAQKQFFGSEFTWDDIMLKSMTPQKAKLSRSTQFQGKLVELVEFTPLVGPEYLQEATVVYR